LKIAYLFETFPSTTETFLAREVEALRRRKVAIEIWALSAGNGARTISLPPRALKLLGRERFWRVCGENLARQLRESGVSHVHAAWANHLAEIAHHAARSANLSWSFAAHARDLWVDCGDLGRKMQSAKFAAVCTRAGEMELKKFGASVLYAPHGIETQGWKWRAWQPVGGRRLLGVGRLIEKKGWFDLLDALGNSRRRREPRFKSWATGR
jgi:glycosyltransferase involved in cell wall biosynthesis